MNCFHKFFGVVVVSVVLSLSDQARAEITPQSWSAGPFVGGYYFDDHQSIKDSLVAGLRLGYAFTPAFTLEGSVDHPFAKSKLNANKVNVNLLHIDVLYHFRPHAQWVPFIVGGVGGLSMDDAGESVIADIGVGLKYFVAPNVALRTDVREVIAFERDYGKSRLYNTETTIAIEYAWQRKKPIQQISPPSAPDPIPEPEPAPMPEPAPILIPEPVPVPIPEPEPAPVPESAPVPIPEPEPTPVPEPVIIAPPPAQEPVVQEGVPVPLDLKFDFGVATLRPVSAPAIRALADFMKRHPETKVMIEGHADNQGEAEYNLLLSQWRADSVKQALMKHGIAPARISVSGVGETQPIASNATKEGRAKNRRVVATITIEQ
jgi:OOP family OmpA-OmpF porin